MPDHPEDLKSSHNLGGSSSPDKTEAVHKDLKVVPGKTAKSNLPQTAFMANGIINKYPSMLLNVGRSGSGKSTVIEFMLSHPKYLKGFFHKIFMFSPTAEVDDLVKLLKIPDKRIFTKPDPSDLDKIISDQQELIKRHGIDRVGKGSRVLILFDDIIANKKFLDSEAMLKLATFGRHSLVSSIINTQSYTKVPRALRLQANALILFPSNLNEVRIVAEDITPPHHSRKDFMKLIEVATKSKHDFLFANFFDPVETRFRRGFETYLTID